MAKLLKSIAGMVALVCLPGLAAAGTPKATGTSGGPKPGAKGSILLYPLYTSSAVNPSSEDTTFRITNGDGNNPVAVHLFFVTGSCSPADTFVCLAPGQTLSVNASDIDPGTTGYIVAVAVDGAGVPIQKDSLTGSAVVHRASGHAATYEATGLRARRADPAPCGSGCTLSTLLFDDYHYDRIPRTVTLNRIKDLVSGSLDDLQLVASSIGGNLTLGLTPLGSLSGYVFGDTLYPWQSNGLSCQSVANFGPTMPPTTPGFDELQGEWKGQVRVTSQSGRAMVATLLKRGGSEFDPNKLVKVSGSDDASVTMPVYPPSCL